MKTQRTLTWLFLLCILGKAHAQLNVGDPGVTFDQSIISSNASCYPQMQRWSEAGVAGGIPFQGDFDQTSNITAGNSANINAAITSMSNSLSNGEKGLIILEDGNYNINAIVNMEPNVSLMGETRQGVICTLTNGAANTGFLFANDSNCGIYNMTIQGGWGTPYYNWNYGISQNEELPSNFNVAIRIKNTSSNCWVDGVTILNAGMHPMRCSGSHCTLRNITADGCHNKAGGAQGYFFIQGADNLITQCYITHLRHISLQGGNSEYNVVYDNDFDQEVSFHSGDNGNNLIENNNITLPYDMPPVAPGDADAVTPVEGRVDAPIYFAIMGPWSVIHTVSNNPNYIINNSCLHDNHNFGPTTPWSTPGAVYSGPIQIGITMQERIDNFPMVTGACQNPVGGTLYPIQGLCTATYGTDVITACNSYTWIDGNTYTSSNNSAQDTLVNAQGCDSIVTLSLTINTVNSGITTTGFTITADESGANYQWIDCLNNNAPIAGETNQSFTATANGDYAVIVTANGCSDTSACESITGVGIDGINSGSSLVVSPNPAKDHFIVSGELLNKTNSFKIYSVQGQLMQQGILNDPKNLTIVSTKWESGVYFLILETKDGTETIKLVKD